MKNKWTRLLSLCLVMILTLMATVSVAAAAAKEPVTIEYYCMWNETEKQAEVIKAAAAEYEKDTGNKVNITWIGRELDNIIRVELEAGENAKVDICGNEIMKMRVHKEYYHDLGEYIQKPYDSLGGKSMLESMSPALAEVVRQVSQDGFYGIPYQPYAILFHYNQEHFDKAGIEKAPETWAEFLDACQKLKDAGFIPTTIDDAYRDLVLGYSLARMKGVDYVLEMMNNKSMWQDDGVLAAVKIYEDMVKLGYWDEMVASTVWPAGQNEVAIGNVSMYLTGTWLPNELLPLTGTDFRWGAFNFPVLEGQAMSANSAMSGGFTFCIPESSKVKDEAFEFITYMVNPKYDRMMSEQTVGIPLASDGEWPAILKDIKPAFDGIDGFIEWGGGLAGNSDARTLALSEFARVLGGEVTAEEFIEKMSK